MAVDKDHCNRRSQRGRRHQGRSHRIDIRSVGRIQDWINAIISRRQVRTVYCEYLAMIEYRQGRGIEAQSSRARINIYFISVGPLINEQVQLARIWQRRTFIFDVGTHKQVSQVVVIILGKCLAGFLDRRFANKCSRLLNLCRMIGRNFIPQIGQTVPIVNRNSAWSWLARIGKFAWNFLMPNWPWELRSKYAPLWAIRQDPPSR